MQDTKALIVIINRTTVYGIQMLTDSRIEQFCMHGRCAVMDISGYMLLDSNLKTFESAPYIYK